MSTVLNLSQVIKHSYAEYSPFILIEQITLLADVVSNDILGDRLKEFMEYLMDMMDIFVALACTAPQKLEIPMRRSNSTDTISSVIDERNVAARSLWKLGLILLNNGPD